MTQTREEMLLGGGGGINRAQRDYWETDGPRQYQQFGDTNEALLAPAGQAMLDAAQLRPGERVLDVGCGFGTSTLGAAERVAPSGRVVGVDISAAMLQPARQRIAAERVDNVELLHADAQAYAFETESFDVVISRFGMMFFEDPEAAFANLARALRAGGRLVFVCPQDPLKSEWVAVAFGAAVAALGRAPDLGAPGAPGPFAFADGDRLTQLLTGGGFGDVRLETLTRPFRIGRTIGDAVNFILSLPESKQLFAGAPQDTVDAAATALHAGFAPYAGQQGVVMDATAWLVTAHR
ncbi:MAG: class I SAM-dependent methyltransferase [Xanthobacteraceae bacterium]